MLLVLVFCLGITSCGTDINVVTGVKNTVYENDGSDMISFYMTSDEKAYGEWEYSSEGEVFEIFAETEETKNHGSFGTKKANFKTLILKPVSEGSAKITFTLEKTGEVTEYNLTVAKDENGILRIKTE